MSEINYEFYAYFANEDDREEFVGFASAVLSGEKNQILKAIEHLSTSYSEDDLNIFSNSLSLNTQNEVIIGTCVLHASRDSSVEYLNNFFLKFYPNAFYSCLNFEDSDQQKWAYIEDEESTIKEVKEYLAELDPCTAIRAGINNNNQKQIKEAISEIDPNMIFEGNPVAFALNDYPSALKILLENGAKVDVIASEDHETLFISKGATLLGHAVRNSHTAKGTTQALLKAGANPNFENTCGLTAIYFAQYENVSLLLLNAGAKIDLSKNLINKDTTFNELMKTIKYVSPLYSYIENNVIYEITHLSPNSEERIKHIKSAQKFIKKFLAAGDSLDCINKDGASLLSYVAPFKDLYLLIKKMGAKIQSKPTFDMKIFKNPDSSMESKKSKSLILIELIWYNQSELFKDTILQNNIDTTIAIDTFNRNHDLYVLAIQLNQISFIKTFYEFGVPPKFYYDYDENLTYLDLATQFGDEDMINEMKKLIDPNQNNEKYKNEILNWIESIVQKVKLVVGYPEQKEYYWENVNFSDIFSEYIQLEEKHMGLSDEKIDSILNIKGRSLVDMFYRQFREGITQVEIKEYFLFTYVTLNNRINLQVKNHNGNFKILANSLRR